MGTLAIEQLSGPAAVFVRAVARAEALARALEDQAGVSTPGGRQVELATGHSRCAGCGDIATDDRRRALDGAADGLRSGR